MCRAKWGADNTLCDDNFYLLKYSKLQEFYDTICSLDENVSSHTYNKYLKDINYLVEGEYYSHELPTYFIEHRC